MKAKKRQDCGLTSKPAHGSIAGPTQVSLAAHLRQITQEVTQITSSGCISCSAPTITGLSKQTVDTARYAPGAVHSHVPAHRAMLDKAAHDLNLRFVEPELESLNQAL